MALDIYAQKAKEVWGANRAGLARKIDGRRMPDISPKGQSKAIIKKRKRWWHR